ncbi:MAG: bifunctional demethylmenaquinone methyltransferase/2-methoxy-6-polyprenyl-1,4-benzoquinol methylase UbiE [Fimbriimonadaceae bacterium]|nr:bifunctional demethylmenaquinone methyltransferase/2-methoxy-6-polyprenyl-1,4-benzoquinol methylase UbiE [Fimbriimonadaceae bacterium]
MGVQSAPPPWLAQGKAKAEAVQEIFGTVAPTYDRVNGWLSFGQHQKWRAHAVTTLQLSQGDAVLDLCCGTGDFLPLLRNAVGASGTVIGLDFARPMLEHARTKTSGAILGVGDALSLPIADHSVDAVTIGWGLRNVGDPARALAEMARVLKTGGRVAILEMSQPNAPIIGPIANWGCQFVIPKFGRIAGFGDEYAYLAQTTARWMSRRELTDALKSAGFGNVGIKNFMFGNICLHTATRMEGNP